MNSSPVQIWRKHKNLHNYLGKTGRLLVWTKIFVAPTGFEHQTPYIVGIVQFEDPSTSSGQVRLPAQVVDCPEESLKVNQKVQVVIRKIGKAKAEDVIEYGIKVKPL
ncbi:OB-fold domain-containing protein [Candidatus Daviesbacteria bacterium]|nr:OB-fold domain-containing protein [Candidatus Daviesbacteria bacterium]